MSTGTALRTLGLPRGTIRALERKAKQQGKSAPEYVRDLIDGDLLAENTFDEVLAPVRDAFLKRLTFHGTLVRRIPHVFDYPRARQDEPYIDLAAAVHADYLVTRDSDLLALTVGHSATSTAFRRRFRSMKIVGPVDFLKY